MVTKRQLEIIVRTGKQAENKRVVAGRLGISGSAVRSSMTKAFQAFLRDLETFDEYFPIFEKRFRMYPEVCTRLRRIERKIKGR